MYRLVKREWFNNSRAELEIWYELYREHTTLFRKREVLKPVSVMSEIGPLGAYRGDLKWARKIAKHYGIKVPK